MTDCNAGNGSNADSQYAVTADAIGPIDSRTVKPLKPSPPCTLPIVGIRPSSSSQYEVISETTGQIATFEQYRDAVRKLPRHIVVTFSPDNWLYLLHDYWKDHPRWTWVVFVQRKPRRGIRPYVGYYGFRPPKRQRNGAYANIVLDASSFTNDANTDLIALGKWVREFCNERGIQLRASAAGIAGQLLRHPDFYPEARRAVPQFINRTARKHLPGPFYESYVDASQQMDAAMYVDQEAAYHYAAQTTPLPNANSVRASGHTRSSRVYARAGGELYTREIAKHGLVQVRALVPPIHPKQERFVPRPIRQSGHRLLWLWTNEIPYLESFGVQLLGIVSTWGTTETDTGIRRYAEWARKLSREQPHLKGLLLMPYGALGRRPNKVEIHTPGTDGTGELLLAGRWIEGTSVRESRVHTYTANALQLGLIQSHVRCLSLDMARQLTQRGNEIISIYADGIFIRLDDGQIPMLAPWRMKEDCLEVHLSKSLRVPVRAAIRRDYLAVRKET